MMLPPPDLFKSLKSDEKLLRRLRRLAGRPMSERERHLQKLSFIRSGLSDENVTYEEIEKMLQMMKGRGEYRNDHS